MSIALAFASMACESGEGAWADAKLQKQSKHAKTGEAKVATRMRAND
jgi:hypothetical protein